MPETVRRPARARETGASHRHDGGDLHRTLV